MAQIVYYYNRIKPGGTVSQLSLFSAYLETLVIFMPATLLAIWIAYFATGYCD